MKQFSLQDLLNEEAQAPSGSECLTCIREIIRKHRGDEPPVCFGLDDCSTNFLSKCPWRFDCGVD